MPPMPLIVIKPRSFYETKNKIQRFTIYFSFFICTHLYANAKRVLSLLFSLRRRFENECICSEFPLT